MRWDVFCKVIDNHGDLGVCWRLARDLAARGHTLTLWVDDASALAWMAPEVGKDGRGWPGVTVRPWSEAETDDTPVTPGDVVIEAFGCDLPDAFVARMQRPSPPRWVNLEYLSAEDYVERSHGLPSPVMSGPGRGLTKHFFYPGFTARTGGLLREPGLAEARDTLQRSDEARAQALHALGVDWQPGERVVTVFCYRHAPLRPWLDALAKAHAASGLAQPCRVLLTASPAMALAQGWSPPPSLAGSGALAIAPLRLQALPPLPQPDFDRLLWAADLNLVRGEDSAVRALWAARPHLWHIYPQDDGVHAGKLEAFMDRWMDGWPAAERQAAAQLWRAWNALPGHDAADLAQIGALWSGAGWDRWQAASRQSVRKLEKQSDLTSALLEFVIAAR